MTIDTNTVKDSSCSPTDRFYPLTDVSLCNLCGINTMIAYQHRSRKKLRPDKIRKYTSNIERYQDVIVSFIRDYLDIYHENDIIMEMKKKNKLYNDIAPYLIKKI